MPEARALRPDGFEYVWVVPERGAGELPLGRLLAGGSAAGGWYRSSLSLGSGPSDALSPAPGQPDPPEFAATGTVAAEWGRWPSPSRARPPAEHDGFGPRDASADDAQAPLTAIIRATRGATTLRPGWLSVLVGALIKPRPLPA